MRKLLKVLTFISLSSISIFAQLPREVWIDPTSTSTTATGAIDDPLGGSGTTFDTNMAALCAGAANSPTYPNLVIHLKAGTFLTTGSWFGGGSTLWKLRSGQRLVGEGIDRSIIRRSSPTNDLYYVVYTMVGEKGVEISNLTIDANYSGSTNTNISCGGLNCENLARVSHVKVMGTSGNTSANNGNAEMFSLRMSGTSFTTPPSWVPDRSVTGGVISDCEVDVAKAGYITGILLGSGQIDCRNNRVFMPHWTSTASSNPSYSRGTFGINMADCINTTVEDNITSGGYTACYSDTGVHTNILIANNHFLDSIRGIEILRGDGNVVETVNISGNIIDMSSDNSVSENRLGLLLHDEYNDGLHVIHYPKITNNILKGGKSSTTTWGFYFVGVYGPICHDNSLYSFENASSQMQNYYYLNDYGVIYNIWTQDGTPVDYANWVSPQSSDKSMRISILSTDLRTTYTMQSGDRYLGLQKSGFTVTLPDPLIYASKEYVIVNETGSTLTGSILNCVNGSTINGSSSISLAAPYASVKVISNGVNWVKY